MSDNRGISSTPPWLQQPAASDSTETDDSAARAAGRHVDRDFGDDADEATGPGGATGHRTPPPSWLAASPEPVSDQGPAPHDTADASRWITGPTEADQGTDMSENAGPEQPWYPHATDEPGPGIGEQAPDTTTVFDRTPIADAMSTAPDVAHGPSFGAPSADVPQPGFGPTGPPAGPPFAGPPAGFGPGGPPPQPQAGPRFDGPPQFDGPQNFDGPPHFDGPQNFDGPHRYDGPPRYAGPPPFSGPPNYAGPPFDPNHQAPFDPNHQRPFDPNHQPPSGPFGPPGPGDPRGQFDAPHVDANRQGPPPGGPQGRPEQFGGNGPNPWPSQPGPSQSGPSGPPPISPASDPYAPAGAYAQPGYPGTDPGYPPPAAGGGSLDQVALLRKARRAPHSGWRRAVHRISAGAINPGDSPDDLVYQQLIERVNRPVRGDYRIAVLSLKGGVGKTTTSVGLGSVFASLRGDRVIAVDANPDLGTLGQRVPQQTRSTVRDLLADTSIYRYSDVRAHTSQAPSRLEILASERDPAVAEAFSEDDYRGVMKVLQRFYNIIITDCGTGLSHSAMNGVLDLANALILVSSPAIDGARSAGATLDWLQAHGYGHLVSRAVVVLSSSRSGASTIDTNQLSQHFLTRCRAVQMVPFDDHLAEGAEVDLDLLGKGTHRALVELAATVADDFSATNLRRTDPYLQ